MKRQPGRYFGGLILQKFKLDDIEIHNAVYDGDFIQAGEVRIGKTSLSNNMASCESLSLLEWRICISSTGDGNS